MALWNTSEARRQRKRRKLSSSMARMSSPSKSTSPPVITAGGGNSLSTASAAVDLPEPDSPARPNTSPGRMSNDTLSTARTGPLGVRYSTRRFLTDNSGSGISAPNHRRRKARHYSRRLQGLGPRAFQLESRVGYLVDGEVDHHQGESDQGDGKSRWYDGPPAFGQERLVVRRPVQVGSPGDHADIAEPQKLETHLRSDGVHGGPNETGHDQRGHVWQDLDEHDPRMAFATDDRSMHEVLVAERQRLRTNHARVPRPAGDDQHERQGRRPRRQVCRQNHGQGQARHDQEHVDQSRERVVDEPAEVTGGEAHDRADHDHGDAHEEPYPKGGACSVERLREHVLPLPRGTEPELAGWWLQRNRQKCAGIAHQER